MMKILVTGGTGLIGSHLIEVLLEQGHRAEDINALVRQNSDTAFLKEKGVQLCYGDLLDVESLKAALSEVQTVFHCAAVLTEKRKELFQQINCQGTEHLLEAARCARVDKFIHVSTIAIHYMLPSHYAASKLAAENKVWEHSQTHGLKSVVIRPTVTVGERDRANTKYFMTVARRKVVPLVNGGRVLVPFVHAKDVARAMILASEKEQAIGNSYDVEGFSVPLKEAIDFFIQSLGSHARVVNVPYRVAYPLMLLAEVFLAIAQRSLYPIVSGNLVRSVRLMATGSPLDTQKIRRELGFAPQYGLEESFQPAIRWQLEQG